MIFLPHYMWTENNKRFMENKSLNLKFLVCTAISEAGISKIFIYESCDSMNKTPYIDVLGNFVSIHGYYLQRQTIFLAWFSTMSLRSGSVKFVGE